MTHIAGSGGYPVARSGRWLLVGWSLFLIAGFLLARSLEPDPRGYGTHQSLGLPPCTMRALFGIPCPGCGMTTCFAHIVRGNVTQALRANCGGVLLAAVCALQIPWCLWSAARGRLSGVNDPSHSLLILVGVVGAVCVINWFFRMIAG